MRRSSRSNGPAGVLCWSTESGKTLYVYVEDLLTKASSACTGDCANDWPPAFVSGKIAAARGITGHLGTITRSNGLHQLTIDGRPLYTFSGDRSPGDLRGNGVGNIWWAMTPTGLSATSFPNPKSTYAAPASDAFDRHANQAWSGRGE